MPVRVSTAAMKGKGSSLAAAPCTFTGSPMTGRPWPSTLSLGIWRITLQLIFANATGFKLSLPR